MENTIGRRSNKNLAGYLYAAGAFFTWGFQPLYWKQFPGVPSIELLAHRIVWSFVFVGALVFATRPERLPPALKERRTWYFLGATSIFIAMNWFIYVWAVGNDRIVEASLGYFINPLVNVLLGRLFLGERLKGVQKLALGISAAGVLYLTLDYGKFPWLSVVLALAFGLYGLLKKLTPVNSLWSLFVETTVLMPIAAAYLALKGFAGTGAFLAGSTMRDVMFVLGGAVTSLPLYLFGTSTQLIPLTTVGFFQYLSPSLMLVFGVFFYDEPFTLPHIVCFLCIWTALLLYTASLYVRRDGRGPASSGT